MTPKEATDVTPFQLIYGGEAVVPVEVEVESDPMRLYDEANGERRLMELDLVDETQDKVVVQLMVGDMVWKKIKSVGNVTKLEAPWVGPYKVVQKLHSGAYYLENENERRLKQSWSANHL
ncbi:uncharacterized protein LOC121991571 [Zingiber officinale]|uniref:uncharacterized protein LOC121991571 n=1 Tax=Zingiber officinale TaxID=94328 RepID=UPI001C4D91F6|nr:uncharacterized protein LOC121991571 [Zingiber officinale]